MVKCDWNFKKKTGWRSGTKGVVFHHPPICSQSSMGMNSGELGTFMGSVAADVRRRNSLGSFAQRSASSPRRLPLHGDFGRANSFRHGGSRREEALNFPTFEPRDLGCYEDLKKAQVLDRTDAVDGLGGTGHRPVGPGYQPGQVVQPGSTTGFYRAPLRDSAASCRRERPGWPFHPEPTASFRLKFQKGRQP